MLGATNRFACGKAPWSEAEGGSSYERGRKTEVGLNCTSFTPIFYGPSRYGDPTHWGPRDKKVVSQNQMDYRQFCNVCFLNRSTDREKRRKNYKYIRTHGRIYVNPCFPESIANCGLKTSVQIPFSWANDEQTARCTQGYGGNEGINGKALSLVAIGVEVKWTALSLSVGPVLSGA